MKGWDCYASKAANISPQRLPGGYRQHQGALLALGDLLFLLSPAEEGIWEEAAFEQPKSLSYFSVGKAANGLSG